MRRAEMIKLPESLKVFGTSDFESTLKLEIASLDKALLPLQQGLAQTSYVSESPVNVVILSVEPDDERIRTKLGVFYAGVIAGSCCADDPTPLDECPEYCELSLEIDRQTAETEVELL